MFNRFLFTALTTMTLTVVPLSVRGASNDPSPDLILFNGAVLTMDVDRSVAQALAIDGDEIIAVG